MAGLSAAAAQNIVDYINGSNEAYDAAAPAGSLGAKVSALDTAVTANTKILNGTSNQVVITPNGDATQLTFSLPQSIATTSDPTFRDLLVRKLNGTDAAPSVTFGTGAGSNSTPTASAVTGNGLVFQLDLTCSASPAGSFATIATFLWASAFATAPQIITLGNNRATRAVQASATSGCNPDTIGVNGFTFNSGSTALGASAYSWQFIVIGK